MDYIVQENDQYYYIDETTDMIGPFKTREQAEIACDAYLKWLDQDHKPVLRKMRETMGT